MANQQSTAALDVCRDEQFQFGSRDHSVEVEQEEAITTPANQHGAARHSAMIPARYLRKTSIFATFRMGRPLDLGMAKTPSGSMDPSPAPTRSRISCGSWSSAARPSPEVGPSAAIPVWVCDVTHHPYDGDEGVAVTDDTSHEPATAGALEHVQVDNYEDAAELLLQLFVPDGQGHEAASIMNAVLAGGAWTGDFAVQCGDGHQNRVRITTPPVLHGGRVVAIVGLAEEATARTQDVDEPSAVGRLDFAAALAELDGLRTAMATRGTIEQAKGV